MDAIDELIEYRKDSLSSLGRRFYRFHRHSPDLLDFFVQELLTLRANGWTLTSFGSLWHHARWVLTVRRAPGEKFGMSQNLAAHYSRAVIILHPEFNGFYEMEKAKADSDFGVRMESVLRKPVVGYVRKLVWADGTPMEGGWRPATPHVIPADPISRRPPVARPVPSIRVVG